MEKLFEVIAEDEELLVVNKPAGLVCHPTKGDEYSSLISRARLYLSSDEPPHMINRLDRETSGIVLMAKSSESAARFRKIWEDRAVQKEYVAIVHGHLAQDGVRISAPLGKDMESAIAIKDCVTPEGSSAETFISVERRFERDNKKFSKLRILLFTGRKHQIRIHLSHIGHPIVGDKMYGGNENLYLDFVHDRLTIEQKRELILENHALHARRVAFQWFGVERSFYCEPEIEFRRFLGE
ncbi:MAG: RluA family pseudouridine synthase [Verrucomicrobiota bacterium]